MASLVVAHSLEMRTPKSPPTPVKAGSARPSHRRRTVILSADSLAWEAQDYFRQILVTARVGDIHLFTWGGTAICDWFDHMRRDAATLHPSDVEVEFSGNSLTPCMKDGAGKPLSGAANFVKYKNDANQVTRIFKATAHLYVASAPITRHDEETRDPHSAYRHLDAARLGRTRLRMLMGGFCARMSGAGRSSRWHRLGYRQPALSWCDHSPEEWPPTRWPEHDSASDGGDPPDPRPTQTPKPHTRPGTPVRNENRIARRILIPPQCDLACDDRRPLVRTSVLAELARHPSRQHVVALIAAGGVSLMAKHEARPPGRRIVYTGLRASTTYQPGCSKATGGDR
jgi:hypothetical protein